jgi:D-alanyl-D-alanine carboxypeptidase (penicillin-binding protein 5/6)
VRLTRSAAAAVALAAALPAQAATAQLPPPAPRAGSALLVDGRSGEVLYAKRPDDRRSIASATKLMTALLALERAKPGDVFTAPAYRALSVESKINLRRGERMAVEDLLEALLLESANDAAVAIAVNVAGSRDAFVRAMNARARELGLRGTSYANPVGLDDERNYSTARDLATLARRLLAHPLFARIVDMPRATLESGTRRRTVDNRNDLVRRFPFVDGVKTGHTRRAGYVLVGAATGRGVQVVSVVLGDPSENARDADTLALLRYGVDQFRRVPALRRERVIERVPVKYYDGERAELVSARTVALTVRRGERLRTIVDAPEEIEGPLPKGARVGRVAVVYRGRTVGTAPLVTAAEVPGAGPLRRLLSGLGSALTSMLVVVMFCAAMLVALRIRAIRTRRARA